MADRRRSRVDALGDILRAALPKFRETTAKDRVRRSGGAGVPGAVPPDGVDAISQLESATQSAADEMAAQLASLERALKRKRAAKPDEDGKR